MIANDMPIVSVVIAEVTISNRIAYTITTSATAQITALRTVGTWYRSRVRVTRPGAGPAEAR